jgi:hypothetical protein
MRRSPLAVTLWLVALPGLAAEPDVPVSATSSKIWVGRDAEVQEFLRTARIEHEDKIPVGVTHPERAFFAPGGIVGSAIVKHLPTAVRGGFWESYKSEIAAYELDRVLGLEMVPVTIERRVGSDLASVQLWVEKCRKLKEVDQRTAPRPEEWNKQVCRQRVFDDLIGNIDRNAGNLLIDPQWNLILIDHSRAFAVNRMPFEKQTTRVDRELFEKLKALDRETLDKQLRQWVTSESVIKDLLQRRDKLVARFEALAKEKGEAEVFPW